VGSGVMKAFFMNEIWLGQLHRKAQRNPGLDNAIVRTRAALICLFDKPTTFGHEAVQALIAV
jgi:hypothetical protein